MRGILRDYVLPGAVGALAAAATALPMAGSLERKSDRLDEAVFDARRELEAVPEEVQEEVARFVARKAELEHRITVIEALREGPGDLVAAIESVRRQIPGGVESPRFAVTRRELGLVVETPDPMAAVRLAEALAANPGLERIDLRRLEAVEGNPERFVLSADFADVDETAAAEPGPEPVEPERHVERAGPAEPSSADAGDRRP